MKVVGKLGGSCLIRYTPEEILPESGGIQIPAVISLLASTYQLTSTAAPFQPFPFIGEGLIPQMVFVNGQYSIEDRPISIKQLSIGHNGISVNSQDTEAADKIIDHIFSLLNTNLKFRFNGLQRKYFSALVVQFDRDFESSIHRISELQAIIMDAVGKSDPTQMAFKRLAFGPESPGTFLNVDLDNIDKTDYLIERRAGQPFSENRYFSSAPLQTQKHIQTLEQIEKALAAMN
jgi:hypothetical protein